MRRDIFIIHSKRSKNEDSIAGQLTKILDEQGYSVWKYKDWKWKTEDTTEYSSEGGRHIDLVRMIAGVPEPVFDFREGEIDLDTLEWIFARTRLIICVNQALRKPTTGVEEELWLLCNRLKRINPRSRPPQLFIFCNHCQLPKHNIYGKISFCDSISLPTLPEDYESHYDSTSQISASVGPASSRKLFSGPLEPWLAKNISGDDFSIFGIYALAAMVARNLILQLINYLEKEELDNIDFFMKEENRRAPNLLQFLLKQTPRENDPGKRLFEEEVDKLSKAIKLANSLSS